MYLCTWEYWNHKNKTHGKDHLSKIPKYDGFTCIPKSVVLDRITLVFIISILPR